MSWLAPRAAPAIEPAITSVNDEHQQNQVSSARRCRALRRLDAAEAGCLDDDPTNFIPTVQPGSQQGRRLDLTHEGSGF